jgi:hypothetical protein
VRFGIRLHEAREIDHREEEIADLLGDARGIAGLERVRGLVDFLTDFRQHPGDVGPVEAHRRRFLLDAIGAKERRQARGTLPEDRRVPRLALLARLPLTEHSLGVEVLPFAEHVRVPGDHLGDVGPRDRRRRWTVLALQPHGQEGHQEEEVSDLLGRGPRVVRRDGVGDLVGFLDHVGGKGAGGLLLVPGTAVGA